MRIGLPFPVAAIAGFLAVAGSFCGGLALAVGQDSAPMLTAQPEADPDAPPLVQIYHPLPDQLLMTLPDGRMAMVNVTLSVEAPVETLLALQATATERQPEIMAALLEAGQATADRAADTAALRADLPPKLAEVLNDRLGTEELPAPVKEVLLAEFLLR